MIWSKKALAPSFLVLVALQQVFGGWQNRKEFDITSIVTMEDQRQSYENKDHDGKYALIRDEEDFRWGLYERPLPCFGCGIGWFSFLIGFLCPLMWYYATVLYFSNYYRKDPRERAGLAASAIAALICTAAAFITVAAILL
uniref:Uncharacterized protein LOC105056940 n=1 Tax=Elaeis guineensis var. tenera TaxID=51953 RepID=A0A6I9S4T5_ELAGV|nr:uncharacterized protein LOC105056940 [Elaeis guineensis]